MFFDYIHMTALHDTAHLIYFTNVVTATSIDPYYYLCDIEIDRICVNFWIFFMRRHLNAPRGRYLQSH